MAPPEEQIGAAQAFLNAALNRGYNLGDALLSAKQTVRSDDVRRTLLLLGDPAQRLAQPSGQADPWSAPRAAGCGGSAGVLGLILLWGVGIYLVGRATVR
jgi:hypothetical protein